MISTATVVPLCVKCNEPSRLKKRGVGYTKYCQSCMDKLADELRGTPVHNTRLNSQLQLDEIKERLSALECRMLSL
jgi:hypothetical protein